MDRVEEEGSIVSWSGSRIRRRKRREKRGREVVVSVVVCGLSDGLSIKKETCSLTLEPRGCFLLVDKNNY